MSGAQCIFSFLSLRIATWKIVYALFGRSWADLSDISEFSWAVNGAPCACRALEGLEQGCRLKPKASCHQPWFFSPNKLSSDISFFFLIENYSFLVKIQQYVWGIALTPSYPLKDQLKHILKQIHFSKVPTNTAMRKKALKKSKFVLLNFGSYCKTNQEMKAMWVVLKKKCTSLTLKDFL